MEAEDIDLGVSEMQDVAFDVDGDLGMDDDDQEALDSDGDDDNEALGIDSEESEGEWQLHSSQPSTDTSYSTDAYRALVCSFAQRKADARVPASSRRPSTCCCIHQRRRNLVNDSRDPIRGRLWPGQRGNASTSL